jgi:predicted Zn-dependent protease with MMP-like domain
MLQISDEQFDQIISAAMDTMPEERIMGLKNVLITYADDPSPEQLHKQKIGPGQLLLGLYEGVPLTQRGSGYNMVLPDKITLFKNPILRITGGDMQSFTEQVRKTLWHEIAHYYGLDHDQIHRLEK